MKVKDALRQDVQKLNHPLSVNIEGGQIVIRVGVSTNKFAFERHVESQPYNENTGGFDQKWVINNSLQFAKDVVVAMTAEKEDGSTPLTDFFDAMNTVALENGSIGIDEAPAGTEAFID